MPLIKTKNKMDFSVSEIYDLRESLASYQRDILDHVWKYYLSTDKNYPIRSLPKLLEKRSMQEAFVGINRVFIYEDYDQGARVLKLNILGALLSSEGRELAHLMLRLLDFIREQFVEDCNLLNLTSEVIQHNLKLTDDEMTSLFRLMNLYGSYKLIFSRAGFSSAIDWSINISDGVVDFFLFDDSETYLNSCLRDFYVQQLETPKPGDVMEYFNKKTIEDTDNIKPTYVSINRLAAIQNSDNHPYDCTRLVSLCKELNDCASRNNTYAVAMLTRAILDHIPPIFGLKSFTEVASNYGGGGKSFKLSSERLDKQMRSVADKFLHLQIRNKEVVPDMYEVNFSQELESVLSEVCRLLK